MPSSSMLGSILQGAGRGAISLSDLLMRGGERQQQQDWQQQTFDYRKQQDEMANAMSRERFDYMRQQDMTRREQDIDERVYGREKWAVEQSQKKRESKRTHDFRTKTATDTADYRRGMLTNTKESNKISLYNNILRAYNNMLDANSTGTIPSWEAYSAPKFAQFGMKFEDMPAPGGGEDLSQMSTEELLGIVGAENPSDFLPAQERSGGQGDREDEYLRQSVLSDQPVFPKSVGGENPIGHILSAGGTNYGFNPEALASKINTGLSNINLADILSQVLQSGQNIPHIEYDEFGNRKRKPMPNISGMQALYGSSQNSMR